MLRIPKGPEACGKSGVPQLVPYLGGSGMHRLTLLAAIAARSPLSTSFDQGLPHPARQPRMRARRATAWPRRTPGFQDQRTDAEPFHQLECICGRAGTDSHVAHDGWRLDRAGRARPAGVDFYDSPQSTSTPTSGFSNSGRGRPRVRGAHHVPAPRRQAGSCSSARPTAACEKSSDRRALGHR